VNEFEARDPDLKMTGEGDIIGANTKENHTKEKGRLRHPSL
jgi:hypothetical protein